METEEKFKLDRKIVEMIDELKWNENFRGDTSKVISQAVKLLYNQKGDKRILEKEDKLIQDPSTEYEDDVLAEQFFIHRLDTKSLTEICNMLNKNDIKSHVTSQLYGEEYLGLIWNFHNRMLPVKLVLHVIAYNIVKNGRTMDFEAVRSIVGIQAVDFARMIYDRGEKVRLDSEKNGKSYSLLTGFPRTQLMVAELPKIRKIKNPGNRKNKTKQTAEESKEFFVNKILGNEVKINKKKIDEVNYFKNPDNAHKSKFSGACFEMGLVVVDRNSQLVLTELGCEFAGLPNPLLENLRQGKSGNKGKILGEEEVEFIIEKIVMKQDQFGLEYILIKNILETQGILSITEIMAMLRDVQEDYIKQNRVTERGDERGKGLIMHRQQKATTTAMRLVEMGLLERLDEPKDGDYADKIAKSDKEYTDALKNEIESRIKEGIASDEEKLELESLEEEIKSSRTGRPKAFYKITGFGRDIYEKILSN